jgi:ribosomal-protein-alanine N-acetyltransferase
MRMLVYRTARLELRPLRLSDYQEWFECHTQALESKNKWDRGAFEANRCTKKIFVQMLKKHRELAKIDEYYRYSAFRKSDGKLVGHVDFHVYERGCLQFANFGYMLHNRFWGMGFGVEMAKKGLVIGHRDLKIKRLEAAIDLGNKRSVRLSKAIGLYYEGIKKEYWLQDGSWDDQRIYVSLAKR